MEGLWLGPEADPWALPLGTRIGAWRVVGFGDRGVFGIVYRAVRVGHEEDGPVALKLAAYPRDPRFEREAWLLRHVHHPSVPRLLDYGQWRHASGFLHPYLVMEWIGGETLYGWASRRNPSSYQVMRLLAQGAWALHATHAIGAVHRDVKGANMLVRPADARLFLMDFGAGHYPGAERLTPTAVPPGTPAYNSPEVWDYARRYGQHPYALYVAGPADDVFAFGVMAYRLVTDEYPPFTDSSRPEGRCWQPGGSGPRPPKELNPRVDPQLDALILRALSLKPKERGTAEELAEELEQRAAHAGPKAHEPLFEWETLKRAKWPPEDEANAGFSGHRARRRDKEQVQATLKAEATAQTEAQPREAAASPRVVPPAKRAMPRERSRRWLSWLALTAMGTLLLWPRGTGSGHAEEFMGMRCAPGAIGREVGSISIGDAAVASAEAPDKAPSKKLVAVEVPPQPLPGQLKPDANGRCRRGQFAINGGCWVKASVDLEDCAGNGYLYRGGCYVPMFPPARGPTSAPTK
jgi:eukaryotic-like serine/threonine-protein kinase